MLALDIQQVRRDFPFLSCSSLRHPHTKQAVVYLDNAATTQKPDTVVRCLQHYYQYENANIHRGLHFLSEQATARYEAARQKLAQFINASRAEEVIFVRGATEAINLIAHSFGRVFFKPGQVVLISAMEHHANIVPWQLLAKQIGIKIKVIPLTEAGEVDLVAYRQLLQDNAVCLVACTHVSNVLGTANPVKVMTDDAHHQGVPVLLDGAQAVLHQPVDVQALGCDFYVFSGHKLYGPTGIGVLYTQHRWLEAMSPYQGGGEMIRTVDFHTATFQDPPHKFEAGTPHIAGAIGLAAAVDYLHTLGWDRIMLHEKQLHDYALHALDQVDGLRIIGCAAHKTAVISFVMHAAHAHDVATVVDQYGIAIRAGHHCAMPLMRYLGLSATARASFALYNTTEEVDHLVAALQAVRRLFKA